MSYDLYLWPIDAPIDYADARTYLDRAFDEDVAGMPSDPRLVAFATDMQARFLGTFPTEDHCPEAVQRVRTLATEWRGPAPAKPKLFDRELDALLEG